MVTQKGPENTLGTSSVCVFVCYFNTLVEWNMSVSVLIMIDVVCVSFFFFL